LTNATLRVMGSALWWACGLAAVTAATAILVAPRIAGAHVLVPANAAYVKECGSCHMAYSPQLLPAASWRKLVTELDHHFGENASLDDAASTAIAGYLAANAADGASSSEARAIMSSLTADATPLRITQVPYIAGLHAAVLDPRWHGNPHPKTLAQCTVCHYDAQHGDFVSRKFSVSDEGFRGN